MTDKVADEDDDDDDDYYKVIPWIASSKSSDQKVSRISGTTVRFRSLIA